MDLDELLVRIRPNLEANSSFHHCEEGVGYSAQWIKCAKPPPDMQHIYHAEKGNPSDVYIAGCHFNDATYGIVIARYFVKSCGSQGEFVALPAVYDRNNSLSLALAQNDIILEAPPNTRMIGIGSPLDLFRGEHGAPRLIFGGSPFDLLAYQDGLELWDWFKIGPLWPDSQRWLKVLRAWEIDPSDSAFLRLRSLVNNLQYETNAGLWSRVVRLANHIHSRSIRSNLRLLYGEAKRLLNRKQRREKRG